MLPLSKKRFWIGASGLVTLVVLAAGWLLVAPTQLGGRTSYVVTSGNSMEPRISKGDLAITRRRSSYAVGDVVLYDSPALRANVLHRIVAVEGDAFVTKGDNNDFLDGEQPALDDLRGELWLVVPGAGRVLLWFQQPVNLGLAAFILVLLMLGGGREVARRRTRAAAPPRPLVVRETSRAATRETGRALSERALLVAGVASVGVFAALGVLAWSKPTRERGAVAATYAHTGELAYAARMPRSPVYPTGRLATGDSVFLRLVKGLDLRFEYTFASTEHAEVRGTISLDAVVSDGQGWTRTLPVAVARPFTGSHASAAGRLGIPQLTGVVNSMRSLTGSPISAFTVTMTPRVRVEGAAAGAAVDEEFSASFPFALDETSLRLAAAEGGEAPVGVTSLTAQEEGAARGSMATRVGLGPLSLSTGAARILALAGGLLGLACAGVALLLAWRRVGNGEDERIALRFGARIVRAEAEVPDGRWVTELPDIDSLVRVADRYDRVILHCAGAQSDEYLVDDGVTVYRYRAHRGRLSVAGGSAHDAA